jgi:hypothetical protein
MAYEMRSVKSSIDSCYPRTERMQNVGTNFGGGFMRRQCKHFLADECGALLVSDWVFLATILVIAVIPSLYGLREKTSARGFEEFQNQKPPAATLSQNR